MTRFLRASPNAAFMLLAAYFVVNFLVRMALPDSLERDEAQQILLSQWLAANHGRHALTLAGWLMALKAFSLQRPHGG